MRIQFSREKYELFLLQMFSRLRLLSMTGTNCTINKQMNSIYNIWQLRLTSCFWSLREDVCFSVFRKCFHEHFARCFGVLGVIPVPGPRFCCSEHWRRKLSPSRSQVSIYKLNLRDDANTELKLSIFLEYFTLFFVVADSGLIFSSSEKLKMNTSKTLCRII